MDTGNTVVDLVRKEGLSRIELNNANLEAQQLRHQQHLDALKDYAEKVMSEWDGDTAGLKEDRAMIAQDIIEAVQNLKELLSDLDNA